MPDPFLSRQPRGGTIAVMVAWNGRPFLETAVPSVLEALGNYGDLLVVENGSTDNSFEFLRSRFSDVAVLRTGENLGGAGGFSAGMRVALQAPECEHVWLLDNDILVEPGALEPLLAALESAPDVAAAGSQLCLYDRPKIVQELGSHYTPWLGALHQQHAGETRLPPEAPSREADYLAACSLLIRAETLRRHGLFRESLFVFYDDVEWALRIRNVGHRLLAIPASVVRHCYGGDKPTVPWREYYRKRNRCVCLSLEPPRRGGRLALYIYLAYVDALGRHLHWQGDKLLAGVYRRALQDFDKNNLGRRDIVSPQPDPTPLPDRITQIWIDPTVAAGDAEAAVQAAQESARKAGKILQRSEAISPSHDDLVIVGERFSWSATRGRCLLRYRCGGRWMPIARPCREWLLSRLRLAAALLLAAPATLPCWLRAMRREHPPAPLP